MSKIKLTNIGSIATYNSYSKTFANIKDCDILINDGLIEKIGRNINDDHGIFDCQKIGRASCRERV